MTDKPWNDEPIGGDYNLHLVDFWDMEITVFFLVVMGGLAAIAIVCKYFRGER